MRFIPHVGVKLNPKGDRAAIEANHVLGLPLTVSTWRVKLITSEATVSDEALMLAKSRSEEGSQKLEDLTLKSHHEWLFLKNALSETQTLFLRKVGT